MSLRGNYTFDEPEEKGPVNVLPKGEYEFEVVDVYEWEESSKGNDMLPIKLKIDGGKHGAGQTYENLVFTDSAKWKIDQFLKSIFGGKMKPGRSVDFETAKDWMIGKRGRCRVRVSKVKGKNYERNEVDAFLYEGTKIEGRTVKTSPAPDPDPDDEDDDVPF